LRAKHSLDGTSQAIFAVIVSIYQGPVNAG
jgi:hypothetical protein